MLPIASNEDYVSLPLLLSPPNPKSYYCHRGLCLPRSQCNFISKDMSSWVQNLTTVKQLDGPHYLLTAWIPPPNLSAPCPPCLDAITFCYLSMTPLPVTQSQGVHRFLPWAHPEFLNFTFLQQQQQTFVWDPITTAFLSATIVQPHPSAGSKAANSWIQQTFLLLPWDLWKLA